MLIRLAVRMSTCLLTRRAVLEALNRLPEAQRGADIMRVRPAYLAGRARNLRQTILLASFASAELNALARSCANVAGRARVQQTFAVRASLQKCRKCTAA